MPHPYETLTIFAEVSIALAGFSGIAIAIGHRLQGSLTPLESRRLFNLFACSGLVLFVALLEISLFHVDSIDPVLLWRGGSAVVVLAGVPWIILDWRKIRRLRPDERPLVHDHVIYPFTVLAIMTLTLQVANVFVLGEAWPFFIALLVLLSFAFQQFILLVRMGVHDA